ncbi:MAG: exodeoxyribonuclease VII large subunit [Candidatus Poseidonia sp.]|nr:exodeoxyribonuclease VII large subunit [Poseidonia sp.]MCH1538136.1 exodeoxyribonuclease VII large subunit [Poseidonia sp.]
MSAGHGTTTGPLPVGQFAQLIQHTVKNDPMFQHQALAGEISQWSVHNGNIYFTLRDDVGQMSCVVWRSARLSIDPAIKVGSEVIIIGSLDLWPKRGNLQLVVSKIQPVQTLGALEEAKRQLVETLRNEGALDVPSRPLPSLPKHIAIVTGAGSAALSDMKRLMANRWPNLRTTIIGVLVQGEHAPREIVRGLAITRDLARPEVAQRLGLPPVDAVIVGRGGGSPEDLWAFNLEPVVRAIMASTVPIISAVGHEQDHLVSDLVADVRASTPSNAVERLVPDQHSVLMLMDEFDQRLDASVQRRLQELRQQLALLTSQLKHAPGKGVYRAKEVLNALSGRLTRGVDTSLARQQQRLVALQATLQAAHPKRVLERGYTMIQDDKGNVLTAAASLEQGQTVNLQFADGRAAADIHTIEPEEEQP